LCPSLLSWCCRHPRGAFRFLPIYNRHGLERLQAADQRKLEHFIKVFNGVEAYAASQVYGNALKVWIKTVS
jgi:hypothetical protein